MEILTIEHLEFQMDITMDCPAADRIFSDMFHTSQKRHVAENFVTNYKFSDRTSLKSFKIWDPQEKKLVEKSIDANHYPVFFENREYQIAIEFLEDITNPWIYSKNKLIDRSFKVKKFEDSPPFLYGGIKFENGIGSFELNINYTVETVFKTVIFQFESFPVKLDFKKDFQMMVKDIEVAYPRLVLDYLKKTYHEFNETSGVYTHLIWWIVFENIFRSLLSNLQFILEHRHNNSDTGIIFRKDEQIKNATDYFNEKVERYSGRPDRFFELKGKRSIEDNYENQVVKFILQDILGKFQKIYKLVKGHDAGKRMTTEYKGQLNFVYNAIQALLEDRFFQSLSDDIHEINKLSPILVLKEGYADLIKNWNKLNDSYRLFEGFYQIELKDTAYLYQIWCFLGLRNLIKELGGTEVKIVQVPLIMPDQFILSPTKDMNSKIMYKFDNGDVAELYHELCYSDKFDKDNAGTVTGDVIPDIVLRVWKNDLPDDMYLTYLFDAKYRFGKSDLPDELDKPEREDLDSMHRYRDAIYYKDKGSNKLSKEVIGSFVLYPGQGTAEELENIYKQTIERVNVGGLPLYPGLKTEDSLVKKHLAYIFNTDAVSLLNAVHSSKWDGYKEDGMNVFIPFIKGNKILQINYLENTEAPLFEYKTFLPALGLGTLRYIAPYVEGEGIKYIYEIVSHSWKARKDVYPPDHELFMNYNRKCLVLKLGNKRMLKKPLFIKGRINNHRYTKLKYINAPNRGFIKTITERDTLLGGENS